MLSFKSIAVFATLAFGAITSMAAPTLDDNKISTVVARCGCDSAPKIFSDLTVAVSANVDLLKYITPSNCTVENISPIVADIKVSINTAIASLKLLVGRPAEDILASVDGTAVVTVDVFAKIVADLVLLIFGAIQVVLDLNVTAVIGVLIPLFCSLGEVIGALISVVLSLTANILVGLDVAIYALIKVCAAVILRLNISVLISIFGIVSV